MVTNSLLIMNMLAVGRMLILTCTKYGPRSYYVHWYFGYRWDTCGSTHPCSEHCEQREEKKLKWNEPRAVKGNLSDIPLVEVVDWGMVLGAVVAEIVEARCPEVSELALSISASDPLELHVHWLCFAGGDGFIGESNCSGVVALDRWYWLRPYHFNEWLAEWYHLFCTYV